LRLALSLSDEVIAAIAARVAEMNPTPAEPDTWMNTKQAAAYIACPRSRIYRLVERGQLPHERDGARLLFRRATLDDFVRRGGARH
jgi:excisionase family DNA binding protein